MTKKEAMMTPQTIVLTIGLLLNGGVSYYGKNPADSSKVISENKSRSEKNEVLIQEQRQQFKEFKKEIKDDLKEIKKLIKEKKQ